MDLIDISDFEVVFGYSSFMIVTTLPLLDNFSFF